MLGDVAAGDAVIDPELSNRGIVMAQRKAVRRQRVREAGGVEVDTDAKRFRPVDPACKVLNADRVALDAARGEVSVNRMQVDAMLSRYERQRLGEIAPQLIDISRGAGIVAGRREPAAQRGARTGFEAMDVVAL